MHDCAVINQQCIAFTSYVNGERWRELAHVPTLGPVCIPGLSARSTFPQETLNLLGCVGD